MSKVRDVLRPFWLTGLHQVSTGTSQSLKGWITDEQYVVNGYDPATNAIDLYPFAFQAVTAGFAHDVDRFGAASFETIAGLGSHRELPHSHAWPLIRTYYAAFYAAHGFCRIFGRSISNMYREEADAIRRIASLSGFLPGPFTVGERIYVLRADSSLNSVKAVPLSKGPHQDTWKVFEELLSDLQQSILSGASLQIDKQEVFACLQNVRDILNHDHSRGNWLSTIRNNLNYRQDYGAWYPHGEGRQWVEVDALFRAFLTDPMLSQSASEAKIIVRFAKGCALVVSLFNEVLQDLKDRHPDDNSFLLTRAVPVMRSIAAMRSMAA